ncbi:MAG TPA: tetratricopeptide repeat protein [Chloroflexia bacterium]|nr:tetratricopeptide repeat protein [Chloroflexia bacterium]
MKHPASPDDLLATGWEALLEAAFLTGDFDTAGKRLEAARQTAEAGGDMRALAGALDQLGFLQHWKNVDSEQRDVEAELSLFERALTLRQAMGDGAEVAESLFHVGLVYQLFRRDWDTSLRYLEQARALAEGGGDDLLLSEIYRHLGAHYWLSAGDFDTALEHLRRSLALRERLGFQGWRATGLITLGQCELAAGMRAEAHDHLREGVGLAEEIGLRELFVRAAREALSKVA